MRPYDDWIYHLLQVYGVVKKDNSMKTMRMQLRGFYGYLNKDCVRKVIK